MDILKKLNELSPEKQKLYIKLLEKQGINVEELLKNQEKYTHINPVEKKDYYAVSSAQKRLYIINQMEGIEKAYNMPGYLEIEGKIDIEKFQTAFSKLIQRHEALRTSFDMIEGEPVQIINEKVDIKLELIKAEEDELTGVLHDFIRPFDFTKAPLMRVGIIRISEEKHVLAVDMHHIISDGITMSIVVDEISRLYCGEELETISLQYKDFAEWQNKQIQGGKIKKQEEYWLNVFQGEIPVLNLSTDFPRPTIQSFEGESIRGIVDEELTSKLNSLAKQTGTTLYIILLAAYNALLSKYTGQEDIVVGSPVAGRSHADLERIVGVFINTLAMRNNPQSQMSFKDFLASVKDNSLKAFDSQDYQFEMLIEELKIKRDLSRNPLFDTVFVMQNTGSKTFNIEGLKFTPIEYANPISKFDLTLNIEEEDNCIELDVEYCTKLFKEDTMYRLINHYKNLLKNIVNNPEIKLADIDMLEEEEKNQILFDFNNTKAEYPRAKTIHGVFEEQVEKVPDNIAVVFENNQLTYKQLNEKANRLARVLRQKGVKKESIVGLMLERSVDILVGILAILKAGGVYLPIDPNYPKDRINFILEDSKTEVLIVSDEVNTKDYTKNLEAINISDSSIHKQDDTNLTNINTPDNLAYIIYTSGTTGKPKGALIEHRNVVRLMFNERFQFDFSSKDVWTMFHSMSFDFSVWEMYGALLYGGKLVVVPRMIAQDPAEFAKLLKHEKVTVLNQTPTAFSNLVREEVKNEASELCIRYVVFGGEALKPAMLRDWRRKYPDTKLINMYGITETTVHVTYKEITQNEIDANISNIGVPIPTLTTYIMDKNLMLLPIGVPGEICVGGDGVCRGYLDRPELTAEKFINNPYKPEERLYRSGDVARFLANGEMEYIGRADHQVKIRGHRIELGEIENQLLKHTAIKEVVVLAKENSESQKYLCAYLVDDGETTVEEIRNHLANELPEYMIPSYFIQLEGMPLTSNGKVDKKALPEPEGSINTGVEYVAPETEIEEKLVEIWKEVLKLEQIGVNDNFFSIGGDSIKVIKLINNMNNVLSCDIKMKDVYLKQTVRNLANGLETGKNANEDLENGLKLIADIKQDILSDKKQVAMLPKDWEDFYPLSQIQNGMVFYSKLRPDEPIYHDQFLFPVKITRFDLDIYIKSLELLMNRHPILRTVFDADHFNVPIQIVLKYITPNVIMDDVSKLPKEEQIAKIQDYLKEDTDNKFKFYNELLWRMRLFRLSGDNYYIILSFQHAILDGWSVSAFNRDFIEIFGNLLDGEKYVGQEIKSSYKDYVAINMIRKTSEKTRLYWKELLAGYSRNKLPFNISGKKVSGKSGSKIYRKDLGKELLERLNSKAKQLDCSVRDICLSAHVYLLGILSNEKDVVTGLVTHDRPVIEDSEKILGCFLNTIPVRLQIDNRISKSELLEKVKKYLRGVKEHELFLSDIAAASGNAGGVGNPIFDTLFNFTDFHVLKEVEGEDSLSASNYSLEIESNEMTNTLFDLEVSKTMDTLSMQIKYAPGYFYDEDVEMAMNLYIRLVENFINDNVEILCAEDLISQQEKKEILYDFNNTIVEYAKEKTMHQIFEEQVERTPKNIALMFGDESITYRELNEKSNRLARLLVDKGVKSPDTVGLITQRGIEMIIGMLAILKAGGAYVPIDPDYPKTRMEYIASNSKVTALLVEKGYELNDSVSENVIELDLESTRNYSEQNLNLNKNSTDLAYIIYTSGSTGNPKGVMIEHHSAVNLISWVNNEFEVGENDTLLFITSMCFDLSVYDIFGILASGGKIVIGKKEQVQNPKELRNLIKEKKITFWDSVPSTMNYLVGTLEESQEEYIQEDLRLVFMSGDWIPVKLPDRLKRFFPNAIPISLGGATEGTIWSIYYPIEPVKEYQTSIPYGRPMDNNYFYILDENKDIVPRGVAGELYIGGVGVARGYMNDDVKTKASFVKDRFQQNAGGMMYKTGDLGRMLPQSNIEFLGRKDHQVKIRGYRVELGEIESQLQKHEHIKDAVVSDRTDKEANKYLCAYIVSEEEITVQELKEYLANKLPDYMVPSYFMQLEKLPLTPNGKIDRKSLPEPEGKIDTGNEYEAPTNEIEEKLAQIWQEVLEMDKVSISDSFFDLGGHSLKATTLVSKIHKELNIEVPLREIFAYPTVREIAKYVNGAQSSIYSSIKPVEKKEYYSLSPAQRRLYLLTQKEGASISYNTPDAVEINGKFDTQKIIEAYQKIVERHEAFRTTFDVIEGEPVQIIHDKIEFNIKEVEAKEKDIPSLLKEFVQPFNLTKAPLLRVKIIRISEERHILVYDMHHIISDGVSMKIMIQELIRIYEGQELKPLRIQYRDFSEWQNNMITKGEIEKQEEYWLELFKGTIPVLDMPTDYPRPEVQSFVGDSMTLSMDKHLFEGVYKSATETGSTVYMILLAAYNVLLSKYSGQEDIVVGTPTSGRSHIDLEDVIGMFVNTVAMRNKPEITKTIEEFIQEVKNNSLVAFENQDFQFEDLVEKLNVKRDFSRNPLFDVMFVLQNVGGNEGTVLSGLDIKPYTMEKAVSKFDLTLEISEQYGDMILRFEYSTALFNKDTIERMSKDYIKILEYIVNNRSTKISDVELDNSYVQKESVITEEIEFSF